MPAFNNDEIVIGIYQVGISAGRLRLRRWLYRNRQSAGNKRLSLHRHGFINFARVMLAALEGRDATSGKVFLPQERRSPQAAQQF